VAQKPIKRGRKLVLAGSRKPQMQREPRRNWNRQKEREFLSVLAETCNVTRALEAVGMSGPGAYKRRKRNAAFRAAWMEAVSTAYQRLELALLDRSLNGTEKVITRSDGSQDRMREFPNQLGLSLLKMHRANVTQYEACSEMAAEEVDELRERVLKKLDRLQQRRERERAERGE
jgi:hypothetical protein